MDLIERLQTILEPAIEARGYDLVRLLMSGSQRQSLQVMIDRKDGLSVTIDDCVAVNDVVSLILDVEDPIESSYVLEVTSPGSDRPLTKKRDFERFVGHVIKLELKDIVEGARRFIVEICPSSDDDLCLKILEGAKADEILHLSFEEIHKAKLYPDFASKQNLKRKTVTKGTKKNA